MSIVINTIAINNDVVTYIQKLHVHDDYHPNI